jgi:hypothetical protein
MTIRMISHTSSLSVGVAHDLSEVVSNEEVCVEGDPLTKLVDGRDTQSLTTN